MKSGFDSQVRHLPYPLYWNRCCWTPGCRAAVGARGCVGHGTYQNGAYWATPLGYVASALVATGHADAAARLLRQTIADFKEHGIYEDVDRGHPTSSVGVLNYTASAANVLWASRMVLAALDR